ncbi:hypothetical protein B0T22DRAFT_466963 [Podospora appendiculata]|uniref:Translation initiation factor IF-3 n=1 Tax=Podospora appendiculata TaxID=314037 RepID=A0AAE0X6F3_9PEZI|nr:hypothetical protein B0T22DRAFT_466963 [Podospora appendiculata]
MKGSQCLFNSATALRKVFINNAVASEAPTSARLQRLLLPSFATSSSPSSTLRPALQPQRCLCTQRVLLNRVGQKSRNFGPEPVKKGGLPSDLDIQSPFVHLRNEDGRLSEPQRTAELLRGLDLRKQRLQVVGIPSPLVGIEAQSEAGRVRPRYPICVIIDRKAEERDRAAKTKVLRKKAVATKELEVNWAIAPNDLNTRMKQLKTFLSKGCQVQILLMRNIKRNKRQATMDEAKEVLRIVREAAEEVPGVKEVKKMEGTVGGQIKMIFQGSESAAKPVAEEEEAEA